METISEALTNGGGLGENPFENNFSAMPMDEIFLWWTCEVDFFFLLLNIFPITNEYII